MLKSLNSGKCTSPLGLLSGLTLVLSLLTQLCNGGEIPKVGDLAPEFELQGSDGETYKLSDFRGKQAVIVAWYPKAFTGG
jgi:peroxiredoxin Q/BCP